jgi:hypothetical protein
LEDLPKNFPGSVTNICESKGITMLKSKMITVSILVIRHSSLEKFRKKNDVIKNYFGSIAKKK